MSQTIDFERSPSARADTLPMPTANPRPHLIVLYPKQSFRQIALIRGKSVIGRGTEADIRLDDEMISRRHCEISWDGEKVTVRDLGSTNGTFVDGILLQDSMGIDSGNRLQIGKMILKIDFKDSNEKSFDRELFEAATTDPLTKIPNSSTFFDRSVGELATARRKNQYVHILLCKVDYFKKVGEAFGKGASELVLKGIARIFSRNKRESDLLARYGEEAFIFLFPEMSKADALKSADRLRKSVEEFRFSFDDKNIPVTVSFGLSSFRGKDIPTIESMISTAEQSLYAAMDKGSNRVVSHDKS